MTGIGSIGDSALSSLARTQRDQLDSANALASGKRITSAASDPSGLAIAQALHAQVDSFDAASRNVADARSAISTAEGGTQTSTDLLSPAQRASVQSEAHQLTQQLDTVASSVNFNGTARLNGTASGPTQATTASAATTNNAALAAGGTLAGTLTVNAAAVNQTIALTVVNNNGTAAVQQTVTDAATGRVTTSPTLFAPGATANASTSASVQLGAFSLSDVGTSATVQVSAAQGFNAGSALTVQSGAAQGATTAVSFANVSSSVLGVSNINFGTTANATNSQGQIAGALSSLFARRAELGAQSTSLESQIANSSLASNNLTSAQSANSDLNGGAEATRNARLQIQSEITLNVLRNATSQAGHLSGFLNTGA